MFRSQALFDKKAEQANFSSNRENSMRQTEIKMCCNSFPLSILHPFMFSFSVTFWMVTNSMAVSVCPTFCHPTVSSLIFITVSLSLLVQGASFWWLSVYFSSFNTLCGKLSSPKRIQLFPGQIQTALLYKSSMQLSEEQAAQG